MLDIKFIRENSDKVKKGAKAKGIDVDIEKLESAIKPSGFYKQKSERLKEFCKFILNYKGNFYKQVKREELLTIKGIGRETADSILLYACNKPFFIVDNYTRRLLSFINLIKGDEDYDKIQELCESKLPKDTKLYQEFHALIVEEGKQNNKNYKSNNGNRKVF